MCYHKMCVLYQEAEQANQMGPSFLWIKVCTTSVYLSICECRGVQGLLLAAHLQLRLSLCLTPFGECSGSDFELQLMLGDHCRAQPRGWWPGTAGAGRALDTSCAPSSLAQSPTGPPGEPSTDTKVRLNTNPRCPAMAITTKQQGKSALLLTSTALQVPRQSPGSELGNNSFTAFQESVQLHSPPAS